jgi:hypothetical protein
MITVHELIEILEDCDKSAAVIFQHEMAGVPLPITRVERENVAYNKRYDVVLNIELTPELAAQGYHNDEMDDGTGIKCIVLWSDK